MPQTKPPAQRQRTMFVDPQDGTIWRVIAQVKPEDYEPTVILRADNWRKADGLKCFATARAMQDNPLQHYGTYFHATEAEAREFA